MKLFILVPFCITATMYKFFLINADYQTFVKNPTQGVVGGVLAWLKLTTKNIMKNLPQGVLGGVLAWRPQPDHHRPSQWEGEARGA